MLVKHFFKIPCKQDHSGNDGNDIRNGFCVEQSVGAHAKLRKKDGQGGIIKK